MNGRERKTFLQSLVTSNWPSAVVCNLNSYYLSDPKTPAKKLVYQVQADGSTSNEWKQMQILSKKNHHKCRFQKISADKDSRHMNPQSRSMKHTQKQGTTCKKPSRETDSQFRPTEASNVEISKERI